MRSTTVVALGISSAAAVLKPAKPSIATIQMPSRQVWDWAGSQVLKTYFKRSSTIASLLRPRALHTFRTLVSVFPTTASFDRTHVPLVRTTRFVIDPASSGHARISRRHHLSE